LVAVASSAVEDEVYYSATGLQLQLMTETFRHQACGTLLTCTVPDFQFLRIGTLMLLFYYLLLFYRFVWFL
jgi:hypothetical protein